MYGRILQVESKPHGRCKETRHFNCQRFNILSGIVIHVAFITLIIQVKILQVDTSHPQCTRSYSYHMPLWAKTCQALCHSSSFISLCSRHVRAPPNTIMPCTFSTSVYRARFLEELSSTWLHWRLTWPFIPP